MEAQHDTKGEECVHKKEAAGKKMVNGIFEKPVVVGWKTQPRETLPDPRTRGDPLGHCPSPPPNTHHTDPSHLSPDTPAPTQALPSPAGHTLANK